MAGIAIFAQILKRNPSPSHPSLPHFPLLSAAAAASLAAATAATAAPSFRFPVAYCDAGMTAEWDGLDASHLPHALENQVSDSWNYRLKEYPIEVKPLFSAFGLKSLAITSLRSFLMYYLPLLEPPPPKEEEDDDFLQETPEEKPVDLLTPFQNSVKQIAREVSVVTTRRVLERLAVHYTSQRMAWKLLKDVPKSAVRKARRGMPSYLYVYSVSKTTFRGHILGVTASWFVQTFIEVYRCFFRKHNDDDDIEVETDMSDKIKNFRKKLYGTTIRCGASLVFASIGAGIGALIHPSTGQWFGCVLGDFAGPIITVLWFERMNWQI